MDELSAYPSSTENKNIFVVCLLFVLFGLWGAFCVFMLVCLACCGWFNVGLTLRAWVPGCGSCLCIHNDCHNRHDERSNGSKK